MAVLSDNLAKAREVFRAGCGSMMAIVDNNSDGNIRSFPVAVLTLLPFTKGFLPGLICLSDNSEGDKVFGFSRKSHLIN